MIQGDQVLDIMHDLRKLERMLTGGLLAMSIEEERQGREDRKKSRDFKRDSIDEGEGLL